MFYMVRIPVKIGKAYCKMVNPYGKMERKGVVNYGKSCNPYRMVVGFENS